MRTKSRKRLFTLLEIMVALTLLLIAAGAIGIKMHSLVQEKKFRSQLSRFKTRLCACHKLAIAMQSDWEGILRQEGDKWVFETQCLDGGERKLSPLLMDLPFQIFLDRSHVSEMRIDFYSTGQVLPKGEFHFEKDGKSEKWQIPEIFN